MWRLYTGVSFWYQTQIMPEKLTRKARREKRRDEVMALVLSGASIRQIEAQTGHARTTIHRDIQARLDDQARDCPSTAKYRELHRTRLARLLIQWWPRATDGDSDALDRVLKIMEREARLLGLDAPTKIDQGMLNSRAEVVIYEIPGNGRYVPEEAGSTTEKGVHE